MKLSDEDHARIAAAVAVAEKGTSGEIRCVLADETTDGGETALAWATGSALVAPAAALLLGLEPQALSRVFGGWSIGHLAAQDGQIAAALLTYILIQAGVFVLVWLLVAFTPLRRLLVPAPLRRARVHSAALEQFAALGLHRTRDRTGILLFASLGDHRAEVLADEGIYAVAPHDIWDKVVAKLIEGLKDDRPADGFVAAVELTGNILKACLPPREDDANELPDGLAIRS